MAKYIVTSPTGENFEVTAPDSATEAEVMAYAQKNFGGEASKPAAPQGLERTPANYIKAGAEGFAQQTKDLLGGAARGAGSIGSTLLAPQDALESWLARAFHGKELPPSNRGEAMTGALRELGADPSSLTFQGAKLGTEIAGTAGVGPAMAAAVPARVAAAAPGVVNALQSAGMTTGGRAPGAVNLLKDLALRSAAGGAVGGASTAMIDPESAGTGAVWGAALPPGLSAMGGAAKWIGGLFRSGKVKTAEDLAKALDLLTPADRQAAIAHLRAAPEFVRGGGVTVAQAVPTSNAAIAERVVSKTPGGEQLLDVYANQNALRRAALEGVSPTNIDGLATAKDDLGHMVERYVMPERKAIHAQLRDMFQKVDPALQSRIGIPFDEFDDALKTYLGPGTFGQGGRARTAAATADKVGKIDLPAVKVAVGEKEHSLLEFVKASGGIDRSKSAELSGEIKDLLERGLGRFSFKGKGKSIDKMAELAHEAGYISAEDPAELVSALLNNPGATRGVGRDVARTAEAAMGDLPQAERVAVPVTWDVVQNLRTSIGDSLDELTLKNTATKEIGALTRMKKSLDEAMMNAAIGRGKPGDRMPADVVARFLEANKSYQDFAKRFGEGTNAELFFKNGPRGGEIAGKYWRGGDGGAERVEDFQKLIGDMPGLMDQFRSMVTTDAASKMTAADQLSAGYVRWVSDKLPALRKAFTPEQVKVFQDVAADIKRATIAASAGKGAAGSDSYQNAAKALNLGLFGRAAKATASRGLSHIPVVGDAIKEGASNMADAATRAKAQRLAAVLSDRFIAADALELLEPNALMRLTQNPEAINLLYRTIPAGLAADH